jgi:prephenate dehydrogenase
MGRKRIAILGLGLIGGSLAFRLKNRGHYVTGFDVDADRAGTALHLGAIDAMEPSPTTAVQGCDVVFIATPVGVIAETVEQIMPHVGLGTIVSDVGSVKRPIMESISNMGPPFAFIGGHPMAGREQGGIAAADPNLFENAVYVLTPPSAMAQPKALAVLQDLIQRDLGANVTVMEAGVHDEIVAAVSHMPHVAAAAIVNALGQTAEKIPKALALAAGGFRDTTRIASGSPELWADICLHNCASVLRSIAYLQDQLEGVQEALLTQDARGLEEFFGKARDLRAEVPVAQRGLIPSLYEVMVPVPDTPGAISAVTSLLASAALSLNDISIVRQREGEVGALRLGLADGDSRDLALQILLSEGYRAYSR